MNATPKPGVVAERPEIDLVTKESPLRRIASRVR